MSVAGWILIVLGFFIGFDGLAVGKSAQGGPPVINYSKGIIGSTFAICGVLLVGFARISSDLRKSSDAVSHDAAIQNPKWLALVEFDEEVKSASVKARSLGQGAEEELAKAYLVLNDKSYLDQILMSLELKRVGDISEFGLLRQKFENVYSLDKQIVAAVLHDGRAVGFLNDRYRLFEDINSYREAIGRRETFGRVTSEPHIAAFVKGIPHLHEQILQR